MASCLIRVEPRLRRLWKGDGGLFIMQVFPRCLCESMRSSKGLIVRVMSKKPARDVIGSAVGVKPDEHCPNRGSWIPRKGN